MFFISMCASWESNPQPFALLTQCSTTEPQEHSTHGLSPSQDITRQLPFHRISLDRLEEGDAIDSDLQGYILHRLHSSQEIQNNVALNGKLDNAAFAKLSTHLKSLSRGSYLYLKLTLDLIEKGYLVLKSSSFKVRGQSTQMSPLLPN